MQNADLRCLSWSGSGHGGECVCVCVPSYQLNNVIHLLNLHITPTFVCVNVEVDRVVFVLVYSCCSLTKGFLGYIPFAS